MIGEVGPLRLSLRAKIVGPFVLIVALIGTIGTAAVSSSTGEFIAEPAVAAVLAGRSDAQGDKYVFLRTDPSGTTLYWTGPIRGLTGQVTGVALVGQPLSAIAGGIRSSSADQLTFYGPSGDVLLSSLSSSVALTAATRRAVQPDRPAGVRQ